MKNKEVWPFIYLVGLLLFNWPLMDLFDAILPYYLYAAWVLFILALGLLTTLRGRSDNKDGYV